MDAAGGLTTEAAGWPRPPASRTYVPHRTSILCILALVNHISLVSSLLEANRILICQAFGPYRVGLTRRTRVTSDRSGPRISQSWLFARSCASFQMLRQAHRWDKRNWPFEQVTTLRP